MKGFEYARGQATHTSSKGQARKPQASNFLHPERLLLIYLPFLQQRL